MPRHRRGADRSFPGVRATRIQSGVEASFRNPVKSGRRSISEAMTAGSIFRCWLLVFDANSCICRRVRDRVV